MLKCHENAGFAVQHLCLTFQMQGASAASCVLGMAITGDKHYALELLFVGHLCTYNICTVCASMGFL